MGNTKSMTSTQRLSRYFAGLAVPEKVQVTIAEAMKHYRDYITYVVPKENWHMTLLYMGELPGIEEFLPELTKPLPQVFVPAVSVTHLGQGVQTDQLWAYVHITPTIEALHSDLVQRAQKAGITLPEDVYNRSFVPHIRVADINPGKNKLGMPDAAVTVTFSVMEAHVYKTKQGEGGVSYTKEATIPLSE